MRMASGRDGLLGGMDDLFYREFTAGEARNRPRLRPVYTVFCSFEYCMESRKLMTRDAVADGSEKLS
jgi:hypothetical protein